MASEKTLSQRFKNNEFTGLFISNVVAIIILIFSHSSILFALWVYWAQSILIGLVFCVKIVISPASKSNGKSTSMIIVVVLLIIIVFFHAIYAVFIGIAIPLLLNDYELNIQMILLSVAVFFVYYIFSIFEEVKKRNTNNISEFQAGSMLLLYFFRILPIHVTIIATIIIFGIAKFFGYSLFTNTIALIFFQIIKSVTELTTLQIQKK